MQGSFGIGKIHDPLTGQAQLRQYIMFLLRVLGTSGNAPIFSLKMMTASALETSLSAMAWKYMVDITEWRKFVKYFPTLEGYLFLWRTMRQVHWHFLTQCLRSRVRENIIWQFLRCVGPVSMKTCLLTLTFQNLLCAVNVQHNCAANHCDLSGSRPVFLERERLPVIH